MTITISREEVGRMLEPAAKDAGPAPELWGWGVENPAQWRPGGYVRGGRPLGGRTLVIGVHGTRLFTCDRGLNRFDVA